MRNLLASAFLALPSLALGPGPADGSAHGERHPRGGAALPGAFHHRDHAAPTRSRDTSSLTVDDALRGSADFSLFRRNDSMTSNPTSQGVSLRGLGPSGTSRSLVLLDGVPLNDPFGGWVPWSLVPVGSIEGAEIVPGGGASAWGNAALGGVIQLFSAVPSAGDGDLIARTGGARHGRDRVGAGHFGGFGYARAARRGLHDGRTPPRRPGEPRTRGHRRGEPPQPRIGALEGPSRSRCERRRHAQAVRRVAKQRDALPAERTPAVVRLGRGLGAGGSECACGRQPPIFRARIPSRPSAR